MEFLNHEQRYIEQNLDEDLFEKRLEDSLKGEKKLSSKITVPLRKIRHCRSGWITTQMLQSTYDGQNRIYHTF